MKKNGLNLILFGPPGVGKGAQAQLLSYGHGIVHLSTGDVIRDEIARGTELGKRVRAAVGRGEFADDETVLGIVMSRVDLPEYANGFVIDGFPRTVRQAEMFDVLLADRERKVSHALFITAPEETILKRLAGRRICSKCGRTYHKEFRRPKIHGICDDCKSKVIRRHDDDPATHRERLRVYGEKTLPLADYYRRTGVLVEVDGDQSIEGVQQAIERAIAKGNGRSAGGG
jgi:adenylate kinase